MIELPPQPLDEKERIKKLSSLNILDTASEERFDRLTRMAKKIFGVQGSLISLIDENRQWFKSKCENINLPNETSRAISFCAHAINFEDIFVVEDTLKDARFKKNPSVLGDPKIRFYAGYPIRMGNGTALGTLCVFDNKPRTFDEDDKQLLRDLGVIADREIAAMDMLTTDDLTSISNRRGFSLLANYLLNVATRLNQELSLCMIDLDNFKQINDEYGHPEGDKVLIAFSNIMKTTLRESDVIARLGGDEFAIIISDSSEEKISDVIDRLRSAVKLHNSNQTNGYEIEFSAGVVTKRINENTCLQELIEHADKQMYSAKKIAKCNRDLY